MSDKPSDSTMFSRFTPRDAGVIQQAIKTSIAATLAVYLSRFVHLPEGYWAAISAIMVMQSDLGAAIRVSVNRLVGTAIGSVVGAVFVVVGGEHLWLFAIALATAMILCAVLNRWETYRFAGVTVAIITLIPHHISPWLVGLHRFFEFSLGIVIALLVSILFRDARVGHDVDIILAKRN